MNICINCQREVTLDYCPICGQKNPVKKINAVNMWNDFLSRVYGFDGMFPRTLRDLSVRPGEAAREYIQGNRVKYYGPVGYLFIILTVYLLLASLLGVDLTEYTLASSYSDPSETGAGQREVMLQVNNWVLGNMRVLSFFMATWSVLFIWLFFRRSGYNFIESSVLIFYVNGHIIWLSIAGVLIYAVTDYAINMFWILGLGLVYTIFAMMNFYTHLPKWRLLIRSTFALLTSYVMIALLSMVLGVVYSLLNPEMLEKIAPKNNKPTVEQSPSK
jgi:hypothetical protein